jgi:hypothetical protein
MCRKGLRATSGTESPSNLDIFGAYCLFHRPSPLDYFELEDIPDRFPPKQILYCAFRNDAFAPEWGHLFYTPKIGRVGRDKYFEKVEIDALMA